MFCKSGLIRYKVALSETGNLGHLGHLVCCQICLDRVDGFSKRKSMQCYGDIQCYRRSDIDAACLRRFCANFYERRYIGLARLLVLARVVLALVKFGRFSGLQCFLGTWAGSRLGSIQKYACGLFIFLLGGRFVLDETSSSMQDGLIWRGRPLGLRSVIVPVIESMSCIFTLHCEHVCFTQGSRARV